MKVYWAAYKPVNILHINIDYVFATKVMANRPKDQQDIRLLVQKLQLRTRAQAQAILDRFVLPEGQQFYEVSKTLKRLFRK